MKCPMCDGTGKSEIGVGAFTIHGADCDRCNGKGVIEPMTNEEYLRTANVDDMATMIATKLLELARHEYGMCDVVDREIVLEWLKQPHTKE